MANSLQEQAVAIVNGMKYPSERWPNGIRGAGAMFAPANFNQNGQDYLRHANDNIIVIVQIESRKAVENCEEIANTDGIGTSAVFVVCFHADVCLDMLFIGPNDLAASMGYFAFDHAKIEEVQTATARVLKAATDVGKYAGHFALSADIGKSPSSLPSQQKLIGRSCPKV
jgi:4-hydroxy-2-oxoheptanedioate aldolase